MVCSLLQSAPLLLFSLILFSSWPCQLVSAFHISHKLRGRGGNNAALVPRRSEISNIHTHVSLFSATSSDVAEGETDVSMQEKIRSMTVRQLKAELTSLKVSTKDVFEKEELVQRLYKAKQEQISSGTSTSAVGSDANNNNNKNGDKNGIIRTPLFLTTLSSEMKVAAVNYAGGVSVGTNQPYVTIQIQVLNNGKSANTLNLLLDTACSGFVLRPSVVEKYDLPSYSTPVTMTGAGGTAGGTGLTQINRFRLGNGSSSSTDDIEFGPLPAAVQDIGALPSSLDGIIGLSFLSQFSEAEMDFCNGMLSLCKEGSIGSQSTSSESLELVAEGKMSMIRQLGIPVIDVYLGDRGPVKMLVDSGAATSIMNWKGVSDLGLSRDSRFIAPISGSFGAIGSDNIAMRLTHRLNVSSKLNLGEKRSSGLPLADSKRLSIDIGEIAILDSLANENVGGILGIDAYLRSAVVRIGFKSDMKLQFFNKKETV